MRKPIIAIKLTPRNYSGLTVLGDKVVEHLTGNVYYGSPAISLLTLSSAVNDLRLAFAAWGPIGNRGSHSDLLDLRHKALTVANMLKGEASYVQTEALKLAGSDYSIIEAIIATSGYDLARTPTPQGRLEMVQNFHRFISRQLHQNEVKLRWIKPLNITSRSNVKEYRILRGFSPDITKAVEVGVSTRGTFTDVNTSRDTLKLTYWIVPYNTNGAGVICDPITVDVLGRG